MQLLEATNTRIILALSIFFRQVIIQSVILAICCSSTRTSWIATLLLPRPIRKNRLTYCMYSTSLCGAGKLGRSVWGFC